MILINKNANNLITVTLKEKTTLASPYYLFKFTNEITKSSVKFIASNVSTYQYRYDEFLITETSGTVNLTSGVITLNPTGFWKYEIFEQAIATNLNEANITGLVESGKVKVIGTETYHTSYDNPKTYIAYGRGSTS